MAGSAARYLPLRRAGAGTDARTSARISLNQHCLPREPLSMSPESKRRPVTAGATAKNCGPLRPPKPPKDVPLAALLSAGASHVALAGPGTLRRTQPERLRVHQRQALQRLMELQRRSI